MSIREGGEVEDSGRGSSAFAGAADIVLNVRRLPGNGNGEGDWLFASSQKAGELPLRASSLLETQIKPAARMAALGGEVGWPTFRHTYSSMLRQLGSSAWT